MALAMGSRTAEPLRSVRVFTNSCKFSLVTIKRSTQIIGHALAYVDVYWNL